MVAGTEVEVRAGGVVFWGQSTRFCFFLTEETSGRLLRFSAPHFP